MKTVLLHRSKTAETKFQEHISTLQDKIPVPLLSGDAVALLQKEGIEISQYNAFNTPVYVMKATHPYKGSREHYVLYLDERDYHLASTSPQTILQLQKHVSRYDLFNLEAYPDDWKELAKVELDHFIKDLKASLTMIASKVARDLDLDSFVIASKKEGTLTHNPHIHILTYGNKSGRNKDHN